MLKGEIVQPLVAEIGDNSYSKLLGEIKELIYRHQYEAMKHVNKELIQLYWEIGEEIFKRQESEGWGKSVIDSLAKELQNEFPGVQGYSARNLWRMRSFYVEYNDSEFLPPLVAEISWSKNCVILEKVKDPVEREFYLKMTKKYGWTKDLLVNNIENKAFEQYLVNQTNFDDTVAEEYKHQAILAVKDDYNFDFIEMGIEHSEAQLESGIIANIRKFLSEMGGDLSFIDTQYHLDVGDDDYYIDLLLFHRRLRCMVAIELKIGDFKPEYAGKMQFYLEALDQKAKLPEENPSVGIIICKSKNRTKVEYTLKTSNKPIGVATYSFYDTLPKDFQSLLPTPEAIDAIIREIDGGLGDD
jgi:predicted nuclease of restriction endonuclease-like (RecB) superfamily